MRMALRITEHATVYPTTKDVTTNSPFTSIPDSSKHYWMTFHREKRMFPKREVAALRPPMATIYPAHQRPVRSTMVHTCCKWRTRVREAEMQANIRGISPIAGTAITRFRREVKCRRQEEEAPLTLFSRPTFRAVLPSTLLSCVDSAKPDDRRRNR